VLDRVRRSAGCLRAAPFSSRAPPSACWLDSDWPRYLKIDVTEPLLLASFLYITLNAAAGVKAVPVDLIRAAHSLGVKERQLFFHVILPESLPYVFTGLKIGAAVSWAVVVAAELVAAQRGLGYIIMDGATFFRITDVYVGILLIGVIGFGIERGLSAVERRVVHWAGR
jgi:ABC-type nitrate/sulfonate/bicarbonate transport system permease component